MLKPFAALSGVGVPLAALVLVVVTLAWSTPGRAGHTVAGDGATTPDGGMDISLMAPDPRTSRAKVIMLQSEYRCYLHATSSPISPARRRHAAWDYNLCATECAPDVFAATHLPHRVQ